jgi:PAS domain S-box-containing protein
MGPVAIFGLIQARRIRTQEISAVETHHLSAATSIAREIDFFIDDAADSITVLTGVIAEMRRLHPKPIEVHVRRALETRTINHITVMTASARSIVNLTRTERLPTGVDYSDRPYIRALIAGRIPQLSPPLIGKVSRRPEVFLGVPVLDRAGDVKAILVAGLDMAELHKRHLSLFGTMAPGSRTLLLGPSGQPVVASDRTIEELLPSSQEVRIAPREWEGGSRMAAWADEQGRPMVGASAPLARWGWTVLSGVPETQLRSVLATPIRRLGYAVFWLLVACVIASPLLARVMTKPILTLTRQAKRIADGALGEQVTLPRYPPKELVELSNTLNIMSDRLARNYREVSAVGIVAESVNRTLDLQQTLQGSLAILADVIAIDAGLIFMTEGDELRVAAHMGLSAEFVSTIERAPLGEGFAGRIETSGVPTLVEDIWTDSRLRSDAVKREGLRSLISMPLTSKGRCLGVLSIMGRSVRQFSQDDLALVTTVGAQISVAIENASLYAQAQGRLNEAEALTEISRQLGSVLDPQTVFQTIARWAKELCDSDLAAFAPYDPVRRVATITALIGARTDLLRDHEIAPGEGMDGRVLETGEPFATDDYFRDPRMSLDCAEIARAEGFVAKLVVPVRSRDQSIGLLWVINRRPVRFTQQHRDVLQKLATHAAVALENARLYQEAQDRLREAETLLAVTQSVTSTLDLQELLRRGARELARALEADCAGAYLISPDGQDLRPFAGYHLERERLEYYRTTAIPIHWNRFFEEAFRTRRVIFSPDCQLDPRFDQTVPLFAPRAVVMVPFFAKDEVTGSLFAIWWQEPHDFTSRELDLADAIGRQLAMAVENSRLHQQSLDRAEALAESEDRYRRLTEGAKDMIYMKNAAGRFTYLNPRVEEVLGYRPEELLGQPAIALVVPKYHELVKESFAKALRGERTFDVFEVEVIRKDGSTVPLEIAASAMYDAEGGVIGRQEIARDLTERRRLEEEVRERKRLEEISRFKSQFLASMSHELRTPLNSILGFSEVLRDRRFGPLTEKQAKFVNHILVSGRHLLTLIEDVLDLTKIEAGKMKLNLAPLEIRLAVEEVCGIVQHQADLKQLTVMIDVGRDVGRCVADHQRVQQILLNLLSNAIKFTPPGGSITVAARRSSGSHTTGGGAGSPDARTARDQVEISVQDTGAGIRPDDLPRLFREFEQLEAFPTRRHAGSGLGLALCKRLVELHGGNIRASSAGEGKGSVFTFTLPLAGPARTTDGA